MPTLQEIMDRLKNSPDIAPTDTRLVSSAASGLPSSSDLGENIKRNLLEGFGMNLSGSTSAKPGWTPGPGGLAKLPTAQEELGFLQAEDAKKAAAAQPAAAKTPETPKASEENKPEDTMKTMGGSFKYPKGAHPSEVKGADDIQTYAKNLNKAQYKEFVDLNMEDPNFKGMGYVVFNDDRPGQKGKPMLESLVRGMDSKDKGSDKDQAFFDTLKRVTKALTGKDNPQSSWKNGVETPGLSTAELNAIGNIIGHKTNAEEGAASRVAAATETRLGREAIATESKDSREEIAKNSLALKNEESFNKRLDLISTVGKDFEGKPVYNRDVGVLDMMDSGQEFKSKVPDFFPAAKQLWDRREIILRDEILAAGGEYKTEDINKPGSKTYIDREKLKKYYRAKQIKSSLPK